MSMISWAGAVLLAALAGAPGAAAQQQTGEVAGSVADAASGRPLAGAAVTVAGTGLRTVTDAQGRFRIAAVPAGAREVGASLIGYAAAARQVSVAAGATTPVELRLSPEAVALEGIVVNAVTGAAERSRELGNVVGEVNLAEIPLAVVTRPADVLTARIAGVDVRGVSGTTGTGQKIRIRGANSISLSNEPLIIVDGVRFDNSTQFFDDAFSEGAPDQTPNRLNDLNSEDIATMEVLKGPAASGLYGTAAANGVILITTKKGTAGAPRWTAYAEGGAVQERNRYPDNVAALARGADGGFEHCQNALAASGACTQDSIARFNPFASDAFSPFREGSRTKLGASLAGGSDRATYFLSADTEREAGVYTANHLDKWGLRANVRALVREDLTLTANTGYTRSEFSQPSNDNSVLSPILNGLFGRAVFDRASPEDAYYAFAPDVTADRFRAVQDVDRFISSLSAQWEPLGWLTANGTAGLDVFSLHDDQVLQPGIAPIAPTWAVGWVEEGRGTNYTYTANGALRAELPLGAAAVSTTTGGFDYSRQRLGVVRAKGFNLTPGTGSLTGTNEQFANTENNTDVITLGGFVQQQLALGDRFFVSGSLRGDDNSAFGEDFGLIFYPSASVSWVVSEEPALAGRLPGALGSLRLRGAVGESGQRPQFRQAETFYAPLAVASEQVEVPAVTLGGTGNLDLKPERTLEWEGGMDLALWGDRVDAELTWFRRTTRDALIARILPPSAGQSNAATLSFARFENIGEVRNQGVEAALAARVLDTRPVQLSLRATASTLRNRILALGEDIDPIIFNRGNQKHVAGRPAGGFWQPEITWSDADADGRLDLDEYAVADSSTYIGPSLPTFSASLGAEVSLWGVLRVSTLFDHRRGHFQLNDNEQTRCFFSLVAPDRGCAGFDDPGAPLAEQAGAMAGTLGDPETGVVSLRGFIHPADFVKWRELAFTLSAPRGVQARFPALEGVRLTVAGRNLRTWTDYPGLDPETSETGSDAAFGYTQGEFGTQPQVRYWTARVDFSF